MEAIVKPVIQMILCIFNFLNLYFDPIFGYSWCIYWSVVNLFIIVKYGGEYPVVCFTSSLGIFMWLWMYIYFWVSYELINKSTNRWIRILFWTTIFNKIWISPYVIRMISYGIILAFIVAYSVWTPDKTK